MLSWLRGERQWYDEDEKRHRRVTLIDFEHKLRVMPRVVRVQRMTRKWGSCSTAGTITLAIDLDEESETFQDFVIAHELLHLKVPNHSRLFKALMTAHVPRWRVMDTAKRGARGVSPATSQAAE
jgi:predicted metal-dependent hydrolase